jgi:putative transposase
MFQKYTYKFRLYPNKTQEVLLSKHFGCARFIYNHFLSKRIDHYKTTKKSLSLYDNSAELPELKQNEETSWLSEVNSQCLQQVIRNLDSAYKRFFKKQSKFPKFKKKSGKNSFRVPQYVRVEDGKIYIRKFKEGIKLDQHRNIEGKIKNATISKTPSGRYYVCILVERDIQPFTESSSNMGIDLGLKTLITDSNGIEYQNIKPFNRYESRIRLLNKSLSRTIKGSKGRGKIRRKLSRLYERIANIRNDYLHKISRQIVNENQVICLEDLNVSGMMQNRKLAKSVGDCSLSELVRQIKYKSEWYGRKVIQVSRWFPSSKTCNSCGFVNSELKLDQREWECPNCKTVLGRDLNAAKNILDEGLKMLYNKTRTVGTTGLAVCPDVNPAINSGLLVGTEAPILNGRR